MPGPFGPTPGVVLRSQPRPLMGDRTFGVRVLSGQAGWAWSSSAVNPKLVLFLSGTASWLWGMSGGPVVLTPWGGMPDAQVIPFVRLTVGTLTLDSNGRPVSPWVISVENTATPTARWMWRTSG